MFQLREEHHEAFEAAAWDAFERRAILHVRANFPERTAKMPVRALRARIRTDYRRAQQYGLFSERQVMCFIDTGFLIGENFDTREETGWTRIILDADENTADERAGWLLDGAQRAAGLER